MGLEGEQTKRINYSTREFYHQAQYNQSTKKRQNYLDQDNQDDDIPDNLKIEYLNSTCPPQKTATLFGMLQHVRHKLLHWNRLTSHYDQRYRVLKMKNYSGKVHCLLN